MKRIVDQHGNPFKPDPFAQLSLRVLNSAAITLAEMAKPSGWEARDRVDELRRACGVKPKLGTITFRRYSPLAESAA